MDVKKIILEELRKLTRRIIEEEYQNEGYKWKPSASQRREFAQRMQNPEEKAENDGLSNDELICKLYGLSETETNYLLGTTKKLEYTLQYEQEAV